MTRSPGVKIPPKFFGGISGFRNRNWLFVFATGFFFVLAAHFAFRVGATFVFFTKHCTRFFEFDAFGALELDLGHFTYFFTSLLTLHIVTCFTTTRINAKIRRLSGCIVASKEEQS
jgi:hypothetical protein